MYNSTNPIKPVTGTHILYTWMEKGTVEPSFLHMETRWQDLKGNVQFYKAKIKSINCSATMP